MTTRTDTPTQTEHALHYDPECEECVYLARPVAIHVTTQDERLREAAERVLDWHDYHEQWNPTGDFDALYAATGRRQPEGDEPVGPRYYAFSGEVDAK